MLDISELSRRITPGRTILFFGAGSSVPSGGPTTPQLSEYLRTQLANGHQLSDDFAELCSLLEANYGRKALVEAIRSRLIDLSPTGGLLVLPEYNWHALYTTNYDRLIEAAYVRCAKSIHPVRSNYEYADESNETGTTLFKIHGCISEDVAFGNKARIVATELDNEEYSDYRETLWDRFTLDLGTRDVVIVGYSLRDPHLKAEIKRAADIKRKKGGNGAIYILVYERDEDRAKLIEARGLQVVFGGIDEFAQALSDNTTPKKTKPDETEPTGLLLLPIELRARTTECLIAEKSTPNAARLFNGSPASYADIESGLTFSRYIETRLKSAIRRGAVATVLVGVAGVGKTTTARRVLHGLKSEATTYEHKATTPLFVDPWLKVASSARAENKQVLLLIDDSPAFQGQVNQMVEELARHPAPGLQLVLTAERSQWEPRKKSSILFSNKTELVELSSMDAYDIAQLLNLFSASEPIRKLVDRDFLSASRRKQEQILKNRCQADMFVALKNMFGSDSLDTIILSEYARLNPEHQEIYRLVAALEAAGTRVHRQLVIRLLNIAAELLPGVLKVLDGLVDEYDIQADAGLYGWRTRHEVIAKVVARFKYSGQKELIKLLDDVINACNPSVYIERRSLSDLCNTEFGIKRVTDAHERIRLYERIIDRAPAERVPHHRRIAELLRENQLDAMEHALREARDAVGQDSPLNRYAILLLVARATAPSALLVEDRLALLREAHSLAERAAKKYPDDKYTYMVFGDIGRAEKEICGSSEMLADAVDRMRVAVVTVLDPQLARELREAERELANG